MIERFLGLSKRKEAKAAAAKESELRIKPILAEIIKRYGDDEYAFQQSLLSSQIVEVAYRGFRVSSVGVLHRDDVHQFLDHLNVQGLTTNAHSDLEGLSKMKELDHKVVLTHTHNEYLRILAQAGSSEAHVSFLVDEREIAWHLEKTKERDEAAKNILAMINDGTISEAVHNPELSLMDIGGASAIRELIAQLPASYELHFVKETEGLRFPHVISDKAHTFMIVFEKNTTSPAKFNLHRYKDDRAHKAPEDEDSYCYVPWVYPYALNPLDPGSETTP